MRSSLDGSTLSVLRGIAEGKNMMIIYSGPAHEDGGMGAIAKELGLGLTCIDLERSSSHDVLNQHFGIVS